MALGSPIFSSASNPAGLDAVTGADAGRSQRGVYDMQAPKNPSPSVFESVKSMFGDSLPSAKENLDNFNFYRHYGSGGSVGSDPVSDGYDYYNAKLSSIYGMDAETAYREALSNTSYQRAVEDLKAAGLNPTLLAGKVSGADSFYGALADSGSSGGPAGSFSSAKGTASLGSSLKGALKDYNVRSGISSVVSGVIMATTKNFQAGAAGYYFSNALLNAVSKR